MESQNLARSHWARAEMTKVQSMWQPALQPPPVITDTLSREGFFLIEPTCGLRIFLHPLCQEATASAYTLDPPGLAWPGE